MSIPAPQMCFTPSLSTQQREGWFSPWTATLSDVARGREWSLLTRCSSSHILCPLERVFCIRSSLNTRCCGVGIRFECDLLACMIMNVDQGSMIVLPPPGSVARTLDHSYDIVLDRRSTGKLVVEPSLQALATHSYRRPRRCCERHRCELSSATSL